jgi:hypothetical protein
MNQKEEESDVASEECEVEEIVKFYFFFLDYNSSIT